MKIRNNGFKNNIYNKKNCLGCSQSPPIISTEILKKLGTEICQIDPSELTEEKLQQQKKPGVVGKKLSRDAKGKSKKPNEENEDKA